MAKELSAGIIIKCKSGYLMCHPTGRKYERGNYDIPKGHVEGEDNTYLDACLRELEEETGIVLSDNEAGQVVTIGRTAYNPKKDLYLFYLWLPYDIDTKKLTCKSMFTAKDGREVPEMNGYMLSMDTGWLYPNMKKVFDRLLDIDGNLI